MEGEGGWVCLAGLAGAAEEVEGEELHCECVFFFLEQFWSEDDLGLGSVVQVVVGCL